MRIWRGGGGSSSVEPASAPAPSGLSAAAAAAGGEASAVPVEHLDPGEQVVAESDGLRPLQMRVPGHHRRGLRFGEGEHHERERVDRLASLGAGVEHIQAEGSRHLVVPGPSRVNLASDVAEKALDRRVDVLVRIDVAVRILCDLGQTCLRVVELLGRQQPCASQPARVLGGRLAVVRQELGIVDAQESPDLGVQRATDSPRPRRHVRAIMPG